MIHIYDLPKTKRILSSLLWLFALYSISYADDNDYWIDNGKFFTSEGKIPESCFGQLMVELNGDDTVAAIFLDRTEMRGCIASNIPYPGGNDSKVTYKIEKDFGDDQFAIVVCQSVNGSMGASCDNILVKFTKRDYATNNGKSKRVLSLEKLGGWKDESLMKFSNEELHDHLKCAKLLENQNNREVVTRLYTSLIESMMYFSYKVSNKVIDEFKSKHGNNVGGLDKIVADNYFITKQALSITSPSFVLNQCKEKPDAYLEEIGRASWMATQNYLDSHPDNNWKVRIQNAFNQVLK